MPGEPGGPVVTTLVCFILFRTRGCGCIGHPAFPTPSVFWADASSTTRARRAARSRTRICNSRHCEGRSDTSRHCEERSDTNRHCERSEAIHLATLRKNGLLRRFAPRNDGLQPDIARNDGPTIGCLKIESGLRPSLRYAKGRPKAAAKLAMTTQMRDHSRSRKFDPISAFFLMGS